MAEQVPCADLEMTMIETAFRALRVLDDHGRRRGIAYLQNRLAVAATQSPTPKPEQRRLITPDEEVIGAVAQAAGLTLEEVVGHSRKAPLVRARNAAVLALWKAGRSTPAIGRTLDGRDHTTILHALKKAKSEWGQSPFFRRLVDAGTAQAPSIRGDA